MGLALSRWWRTRFEGDTERMLREIIDEHPAGWSTLCANEWGTPGFGGAGVACYCHGERHKPAQVVTEKNASECGCEYAYVFKGNRMLVLSSYTPSGHKMVGAFGCGDPGAHWRQIRDVDLAAPGEPLDWVGLS